MKDYLNPKEEIATIKERNITISLSDSDCERLLIKAGSVGLTVNQLLRNFIVDLVDGIHSNGSDERMLADEWYNRCWFSLSPEETLLNFLLINNGIEDVDYFIELVDEIEALKSNDCAEEDLEDCLIEYQSYVEEFLGKYPTVDIEKEITVCREWLTEYNQQFKSIVES